jgi:hypothetical protein
VTPQESSTSPVLGLEAPSWDRRVGKSTLIKVLSGYHAPKSGGGIRIQREEVPVESSAGGHSGALASRLRRNHRELYRSHNSRWSRLTDCRLPLRQELHRLETAADPLLVRTTSNSSEPAT